MPLSSERNERIARGSMFSNGRACRFHFLSLLFLARMMGTTRFDWNKRSDVLKKSNKNTVVSF